MQDDEIIRSMIQHEDSLANNRLGWLNTIQGLLFAALALGWTKPPEPKLIFILTFVGVGVSVLSLVSMQLGALAKKSLLLWWKANKGTYSGPNVIGYYVGANSYLGLLAPSNLLPLLFLVAWVAIFVCR